MKGTKQIQKKKCLLADDVCFGQERNMKSQSKTMLRWTWTVVFMVMMMLNTFKKYLSIFPN